MGSVVNTNVSSLATQQALALNQRTLDKSTMALSTGHRINSAADDAAGLAISNKLITQARSLDVAVRNANDGISMLQTADGASGQMVNMLFRMRELAVQSANDTNSQSDRDALQSEFKSLQQEIGNTIGNTTWNGMKLLDGGAGTSGTLQFQVGAASSDSISLPLATLNSNDVQSALSGSADLSTQTKATNSVGLIDKAITQIDGERSKWGAMMNRLTYAADNAANVSLNSKASQSRITDTDYAQATAEMARAMILDQAGSAMLSQANQQPYYVLALLR